MPLIPQEARAWSRVRLDREPTDLDPDDLAYAMNADLFLEPGTIRIRRGIEPVGDAALSELSIRGMAKVATLRYRVAAQTLFRDVTSIRTGLSSRNVTTIQPARPLNDTTTWAFIADAAGMYKDNGTSLVPWSLAPPTAISAGAGALTGLTGNYWAQYTYVRKIGDTVVAESNPYSTTAVVTLADQSLDVGVVASTDSQVTHIRLYRTTSGGALFLYDQEVANTTQTMSSTKADSALGSAAVTDNDRAPACGFISAPFFDRFWLCQDQTYPHYLWYSKRFQPEAVPVANYLILGTPDDPIQSFIPFGGVGIAFTQQRKYRIVGTGTTSFVPYETPGKRGTLGHKTAIVGEDGVYFVSKDGVFRTTGFSGDEQLAGPILPLFNGDGRNGYAPINFAVGHTFSLAIWKGRLYFAYADTDHTTPNMLAVHRLGTNQWQFYDLALDSLFVELDTDLLLGGGQDGICYSLETGTDDAGLDITMTIHTKDYAHVTPESPAGSTARKLYFGVKTDCDPGAGLTEAFYCDGVLKHTDTVTLDRVPSLRRLPANAQGYRWTIYWTYTGQETVKVYGTNVLAQPL